MLILNAVRISGDGSAQNMSNIVIFGATSAIAMAIQRNMVNTDSRFYLIARNASRLQEVANDLLVRGASACFTQDLDVTTMGYYATIMTDIVNKLGKLEIVIIAHGTLTQQELAEESTDYLMQELNINCLSTIILASIIANILEKQQSGTLCVLSSVAGDRGRQSNYVYGAAKGCVSVFMQGLRNRLYPSVHVLTVKPGFVITPMTRNLKKGMLWVEPEVVARDICKAIESRRDVLYTPWFWRWIMLVIKLIPERYFKRMSL